MASTQLAIPNEFSKILSVTSAGLDRGKISQVLTETSEALNMQRVIELNFKQVGDKKNGYVRLYPNIGMMMNGVEGGIQQVNKVIDICIRRFIALNFQNNEDTIQELSYELSNHIMMHYKDFTLFDVIYFFKYIRSNIHRKEFKTFGLQLTQLKLFEMFDFYLEDRQNELQQRWRRIADESDTPYLPESDELYLVRYQRDINVNEFSYVRLEKLNAEKVTGVFDSEKNEASLLKWKEAYDLRKFLISQGHSTVQIVTQAGAKMSLPQYIRASLPNLLTKPADQKSTISAKEPLDKIKMAKILDFIQKCEDLDAQEKASLKADVEKNKKIWKERNANEAILNEKYKQKNTHAKK